MSIINPTRKIISAGLGRMNGWTHCRYFSQSSTRLSQILVDEKQGIRRITLASPKSRNALSFQLLEELNKAVTKDSKELRCIVIDAQGKVFSGGHNLKELTTKEGRDHHQAVFDTCSQFLMTLQMLPVPVIAVVNGVAAAAGCQLVASCDIVIASENSTFSTPGASVGIFCSTPGIPLVRCVTGKQATHMLLTGLPVSAREALVGGLISKVVKEEDLEAETEKVIMAITSKSKSVIALGKKFMYAQMEMGIEEAYRHGACVMVDNINMEDGQEGIKSFIEKHKPNWSHSKE